MYNHDSTSSRRNGTHPHVSGAGPRGRGPARQSGQSGPADSSAPSSFWLMSLRPSLPLLPQSIAVAATAAALAAAAAIPAAVSAMSRCANAKARRDGA